MKQKCPYNCKCTRKIKDYCCAEKGFICAAKQKDNSLDLLEQLMIENADVLIRLKNR